MTGHLQLAPSVDHQVSAMLSILDRYNWRQFGIVTSEIAGHDDFVQAVRDGVNAKAIMGRRYVRCYFSYIPLQFIIVCAAFY